MSGGETALLIKKIKKKKKLLSDASTLVLETRYV